MKTILAELDRMATKGQLGKGKVFEPVVARIPFETPSLAGRLNALYVF